MELTEDEIIKKHGTLCKRCSQIMLLLYEYEWICFGCGYDVIEQKNELSKVSRRKINNIIRLKYDEHEIICIFYRCI